MLEDDGYYEGISDNATIHSGEEDQNDLIPIKEGIVNLYKTQIVILNKKKKESETINKRRKIYIDKTDINNKNLVKDILRRYIPEKGTVGIHCELSDSESNKIQLIIVSLYSNNSNLKFIKCTNNAVDLLTEDQLLEKIKETHEKSNHRGILENYEEIKNKFYFQGIIKVITKFINNCETCNLAKYNRKPIKPEFQISETPKNINEIAHIDIFQIGKKQFFTTIDKHLYTKETLDKNAITFINLLRERNAIIEQIRILAITEPELKIEEKVLKATEYYNSQQGQINKEKLYEKLKSKKCKWINYQNRKREKQPEIEQKEIYIKNYTNERHKEQPKFRKVDIIKGKRLPFEFAMADDSKVACSRQQEVKEEV
ncbi:unnamed protein product [Hermetia illucens]|uniref:Integrase zinc-binding domain-containing protein n=1 Tax=Hermetia illucens TaxID=343691 RepID=A0A7R8V4E3_HERIL|nr:unnamed protein product [Hermetia illucens]